MNLLFSVSQDSILSTLDNLFSVLDSQFAQKSRIESRIVTHNAQTVNLLLNGTEVLHACEKHFNKTPICFNSISLSSFDLPLCTGISFVEVKK